MRCQGNHGAWSAHLKPAFRYYFLAVSQVEAVNSVALPLTRRELMLSLAPNDQLHTGSYHTVVSDRSGRK